MSQSVTPTAQNSRIPTEIVTASNGIDPVFVTVIEDENWSPGLTGSETVGVTLGTNVRNVSSAAANDTSTTNPPNAFLLLDRKLFQRVEAGAVPQCEANQQNPIAKSSDGG
jgi:hypothetical protein